MSVLLTQVSDDALPEYDIRAVFFDIDGTLLGLDGSYTTVSRREISRIKHLGIKTAIASGRPSFAATFLMQELGLDDPGQFCTGAHIYYPRQKQDLFLSKISAQNCVNLISSMRDLDLYCEVYTGDSYFIERSTIGDSRFQHITETHSEHMRVSPEIADLDKLILERPIIKFLSAVDNKTDQAKLHRLEKKFPQMHFAYAGIAAYPDWLFVSIVDERACKERVFDQLLSYHDLAPEQVMCFGDAQSDTTFIKRAGVGVAMGNATDALKSVATYVTKPVWQDGVAYALSRLIR